MRINVIYATQNNFTRKLAILMHDNLKQLNILTDLYQIDQIGELEFKQPFIYATSTFSQGQHPTMARIDNKFIPQAKIYNLQGVKFTVFGVGSRCHPKFNQAAKDARDVFLKLKGQEIANIHLFDVETYPNLDKMIQFYIQEVVKQFE